MHRQLKQESHNKNEFAVKLEKKAGSGKQEHNTIYSFNLIYFA